MKKLVLLILSFTLSSQVFAEVSQEYLANALEIEKSFLLAVTTGINGEKTAGRYPYLRVADSTPSFYIKETRSCKSNPKCTDEVVAEALASAKRFAADYNALVGKEVVTVSDESSWGGIPISLVENLDSYGRWYCQSGFSTGSLKQCGIRVRFSKNGNIGQTIAHEMLNVIAIQDTRNNIFEDCLSYDYGVYNPGDYKGLCDAEQRAIVFAFNHLRSGMRKGSVGKAFDKHWKPSNFTYALAAKLEEQSIARYPFCQKFKSPSCLKEFPSLKDS